MQSSKSSPLFQACLPFSSTRNFRCFSFSPGPFLSTRQSLEGSTWRSAAFCFPHSSLLLSALNALDRRSSLPSTTRFSNSAALLSEPIWHQTLRLHQPDTRPRVDLTAVKTQFWMNSLECFVTRLTSRRHSLQLVLQFSNDSFSNSPSADECVPWTKLRLSEELRYHESAVFLRAILSQHTRVRMIT